MKLAKSFALGFLLAAGYCAVYAGGTSPHVTASFRRPFTVGRAPVSLECVVTREGEAGTFRLSPPSFTAPDGLELLSANSTSETRLPEDSESFAFIQSFLVSFRPIKDGRVSTGPGEISLLSAGSSEQEKIAIPSASIRVIGLALALGVGLAFSAAVLAVALAVVFGRKRRAKAAAIPSGN
jgi:hypothetical protein